jgi:SPX domain protein involved in polyphosphate accumulation
MARFEIKAFVRDDMIPQIVEYILPHVELDSHVKDKKSQSYVVRTLYYDTQDLDYYWEKLDGLEVRKKIRIRVYNEFKDRNIGFVEIKRRYDKVIIKERSKLPFSFIRRVLAEPEKDWLRSKVVEHDGLVLGKFLYNIHRKDLRPTLLVVYDRKAFQGIEDPKERLTIDSNVRVRGFPEFCDIYDVDDLEPITKNRSILELKFDNAMPRWMRLMMTHFHISVESISKYCMGVEATVIAHNGKGN